MTSKKQLQANSREAILRETLATLSAETADRILAIARRIAPKYSFGVYDKDDLIQEAFLMGVDGYSRWDGVRPLENFLSVHISRRLKNFQRDNHYRLTPGQSDRAQELAVRRQRILEPIPLERTCPEGEPSMCVLPHAEDDTSVAELLERVSEALPRELRLSWLQMQDGLAVSPAKRRAVCEIINEVLGERSEQ